MAEKTHAFGVNKPEKAVPENLGGNIPEAGDFVGRTSRK
jgi:hypothetical protein